MGIHLNHKSKAGARKMQKELKLKMKAEERKRKREEKEKEAQEEEEEARLQCTRGQALGDLCFAATHTSFSIFPTGYIPTHSPTSPTSTSRAARAHDADLQICRSVPP